MTQPVDSSILHEIVRIIDSRRKVPEKVIVKSKEYALTYLEDHQRRLEEALMRFDKDRLNMLYGQLASKIKYQMLRRVPARAAAAVGLSVPKPPAAAAKPAVKPAAKAAAARPAARKVAKPAPTKAAKPKSKVKPKAAPAPAKKKPAAVKAKAKSKVKSTARRAAARPQAKKAARR